MNLQQLKEKSHEISRSKGWHDPDAPRASFADRIALILSEQAEALEEYRNGHQPWEVYFLAVGSPPARAPATPDWASLSLSRAAAPVGDYLRAHELARFGRKPEGIPIEIADVCIRIGDFAGRYEVDLVEVVVSPYGVRWTFSDWLLELARHTMRAWEMRDRDGDLPSEESVAALSAVVRVCECMGEVLDFDLAHAIEIKHAFNATRPHRHGGKKI